MPVRLLLAQVLLLVPMLLLEPVVVAGVGRPPRRGVEPGGGQGRRPPGVDGRGRAQVVDLLRWKFMSCSHVVKSCVNLLTWLLIGCVLLCRKSGASLFVDTTLDNDYNS